MNASPGVAAETPPVVRSVWRVVARAMTLTLFAVAWACSNTDSTSPSVRPVAGSRDVSNAHGNSGLEPIPGQYIITFSDSVSDVPGLAKRIAAQYGKSPRFTYTDAIKGFAAELPDQAIEALSHNPHIERIEQDALVEINATSQTGADWGLDRLDQRNRPLDGIYSYASDGAGVNVYIIDTGIRTTHDDFGGRAYGAVTFVNDGRGTNDCGGHGTPVAATVGGTKYGVAKGVRLYAVRVMDCSGTGTASAIIAGVDWVTKNRVLPAVANMSLGTPFYSTLNAAVQNSIKAGIVYVVAAGNSNADACTVSPASTPEAITVAASGNSDAKSSFSNYGKCVDIFAPGEAIESAWVTSDTSSMILGGTSMAAPHVAGVAALYLSANPTASPAEVSAAIMNGGTSGVLSGVPSGTPNLLVYSVLANAILPPPPPPPPPVDTGTVVVAPLTVDQPPTAAFAFNCAKAKCTFDASGSRDDIGIVSYGWNFGDGSATVSASTVAKLSHTYSKPGSFTVTLQVTDTAGHSSSKAVTVVVKKV